MNNQGYNLDLWKKVIEKTINVKEKASLQPSFGIRKIDSRYSKSCKLSAKKDKDKTNWEYWNENKAKSHNPSSTNTSQFQT